MCRQSMQTKCTAPSRETAGAGAERLGEEGPERRLAHLARGHRELAVPALGVGVAVDPDVVGRIEEGRVDPARPRRPPPAGSRGRGRRRSRRGARRGSRCRRAWCAASPAPPGSTSSSGSAVPLRITSISPVEKPVSDRSKSTSSAASSPSSSFRRSRSQPAPSAILLSASRSARFCASVRAGERDRRHLGHADRLRRQQPAVPGDDHRPRDRSGSDW